MRTNIEIDDELMRDALAATGLTTKRDVVAEGLRSLVRRSRQREALDVLWGSVPDWGADLANIPYDEWPDWSRHLRHDAARYAELRAQSEKLFAERLQQRAA